MPIFTLAQASSSGYPTSVLAVLSAGDHYWRMGAASGAEPDQKSSASLTVSGATRDVTGPAALGADDDGACSFDGSSNFASAALNLSSTSVVTVAGWVKIDAYSTDNALLWEHTATWNSNEGAVNVNPNNSTGGAEANTWSIGCGGPSGKARVTIPQSAIPATEWHHLAVVFALTGSIKVYVDGVQVTATVRDGGVPGGTFANDTFYLASRAGGAQFLAHDQDELVVALSELSSGAIATLAGATPPGPATLYVDADHAGASDAGDRTAAQSASTPLVTLNRAVALAVTGDTIRVVKSAAKYAAMVSELGGATPTDITVVGSAGGTGRPVIDRLTLGDADTWTFQDLIFDGTPGNPSFIYRLTDVTFTRCDFRQGGGQLLHWNGLVLFEDCDIAAPFDSGHAGAFMTGVGWRVASEFAAPAFHADDLTFRGCSFHDIGGEDAIQLQGLGNNSHTGTVLLEACTFADVAQGIGSSTHTDCLQSLGCDTLIVRACRFDDCESMLIASDGYINTLVVENNLFVGSPISGFSTQFSGVRDATIRHNTWVASRFGGLRWYVNSNAVTPVRAIYNNVIDKYDISDGWTPSAGEQHHNLILIGPSTAADLAGFPEFGTSGATDYELADMPSASPGIDAGAVVSGSPTTDRLGRARVGAPDVGCHENQGDLISADARAPYLISVSPASGATGVAVGALVQAVLFPKPGESIDAATVTTGSFLVRGPDGVALPVASVGVSGPDVDGYYLLSLTVDGELLTFVAYSAAVSSAVKDSEGSAFAGASWSFRVVGTSPAVLGGGSGSASHTMQAQWPAGTVVGVYPASAWVERSRVPSGPVVTAGTVTSSSVVTFDGVTPGVRYVAYALGLGVTFLVPDVIYRTIRVS